MLVKEFTSTEFVDLERNDDRFKLLLDVDDVIYGVNKHGVQYRFVIDRVTNTRAYSGERKFKRELGDNDEVFLSGEGSSWSVISYFISNERLEDAWYRKKTLEKLNSVKFTELTTEQLKEMIRVISADNESK